MNKSNLTKLREQNKLTQTDVALMLGISNPRLYYYEIGARKIPIDIAEKLAKLYKVDIEEIFLPETFSIR